MTLAEGVKAAAERLAQVTAKHGEGAVAAWGSPRSSLETQEDPQAGCAGARAGEGPHFFLDAALGRKVTSAVARLDSDMAVSMRELEGCDFIVVAGADPVNEAPMLALALRQAQRRGAKVAVLDPRPVLLPFAFEHFPVPFDGLDLCLNLLAKTALTREAAEGGLSVAAAQFYDSLTTEYPADPELQDRLVALGMKLKDCQHPAVVCNTALVRETTPLLAADHARLLKEGKGKGGLFYLLPGANAFGAALLSGGRGPDPLEALESGAVKALLVVESDPLWSYPDQERLLRALTGLELLVVLDYVPSAMAARAQVFLPTLTVFEMVRSHFINQEGRLQEATPLYFGGTPIHQVSGGESSAPEIHGFCPRGGAPSRGRNFDGAG